MIRSWKASLIAVAVAAAGCGVPGAAGPLDTFGLDFTMPPGSQVAGAVVFLVDGLNARVFAEMLEAGELPAISRHFADRGLYAPTAVANTPSVTLPNLTSLVTGRFPGHHGVTGINWFDRNRLLWRDYETIAQKNTLDGDYTAGNIYEQLHDQTTFSVFFQPHRGATKFIENWTSAGPMFFFGMYETVDRLTLFRLNIVADVARRRGRFPAVTICYLLAPDFRAYAHGLDSEQYREAIRHTDRQIGRVLGDLARAGLLEKLWIVLTSDHGMGEVGRHLPMDVFLRRSVGLSLAPGRLWEETSFEKRLAHYRRYAGVLYGSGDKYLAICLRRPIFRGGKCTGFAAWPIRPRPPDLANYPAAGGKTVDLPALLCGQEAVDAVAYAAGPNRVYVRRSRGQVEFRQPGGPGAKISYISIRGGDPLGWGRALPAAALAGRPAEPDEWLAWTSGTDYPDLPAQILAYFRAPRAGDIAVFAAPGWDFNNVNRAGHGGLRPEDMHVPLLLAGPGIDRGKLSTARTADLMPTLLKLLGRRVPAGVDGRPLVRAD